MPALEIQCPQPIRPLKRKAAELDAASDSLDEHSPFKKQHLFFSFSSLDKWLSELPIEFDRSANRSDSFLTIKMKSNQPRSSDKKSRSGSLSSLPTGFPNVEMMSPPNSLSNPRVEAIFGSKTPRSGTQDSVDAESDDSKTPNARVRNPLYRNDLKLHGVYVDAHGRTMPQAVRDYAQTIMEKQRKSPGLNEAEMAKVRKELYTLDSTDEDVTRMSLARTDLFPLSSDFDDDTVAVGGSIPFNLQGLPYTSGRRFKPIAIPKPDLHYGYPSDSFNHAETMVMQRERLSPYAAPSTASYWPFFAVEFKSPSRGGTDWVAENQNAGTGAHSVNSVETLMSYTKNQEKRKITDSVFFSCVANASHATLWVHWRALGDEPRIVSGEMNMFSFKKPDSLRTFHATVKNIIDHGINERLTRIKEALNDCLPLVPEWFFEEDEKRKAKKRKQSSQSSSKSQCQEPDHEETQYLKS